MAQFDAKKFRELRKNEEAKSADGGDHQGWYMYSYFILCLLEENHNLHRLSLERALLFECTHLE